MGNITTGDSIVVMLGLMAVWSLTHKSECQRSPVRHGQILPKPEATSGGSPEGKIGQPQRENREIHIMFQLFCDSISPKGQPKGKGTGKDSGTGTQWSDQGGNTSSGQSWAARRPRSSTHRGERNRDRERHRTMDPASRGGTGEGAVSPSTRYARNRAEGALAAPQHLKRIERDEWECPVCFTFNYRSRWQCRRIHQ